VKRLMQDIAVGVGVALVIAALMAIVWLATESTI